MFAHIQTWRGPEGRGEMAALTIPRMVVDELMADRVIAIEMWPRDRRDHGLPWKRSVEGSSNSFSPADVWIEQAGLYLRREGIDACRKADLADQFPDHFQQRSSFRVDVALAARRNLCQQ